MDLYIKGEQAVKDLTYKSFPKVCEILELQFSLVDKIFHTLKLTQLKDEEKCFLLITTLGLKTLYNAFNSVLKGYLNNSEVLIRMGAECFISAMYLKHNPDKSKKWVDGKSINELGINRFKIAKELDNLVIKEKIFPTNAEDFFTKFIYKAFYEEGSQFVHLDFNGVLAEVSLEKEILPSTLIYGPKFETEFTKTTLNRLCMLTMYSISSIEDYFRNQNENSIIYSKIFRLFKESFFEM